MPYGSQSKSIKDWHVIKWFVDMLTDSVGFDMCQLSGITVVLFYFQLHYFGEVLALKNHPNYVNPILAHKKFNIINNIFNIWVWKSLNHWAAKNNKQK